MLNSYLHICPGKTRAHVLLRNDSLFTLIMKLNSILNPVAQQTIILYINVCFHNNKMHKTQFGQPNSFRSLHDKTKRATQIKIVSNKF